MRLARQMPPTSAQRAYLYELRGMLVYARALVKVRVMPLLSELVDRAAVQRGDAATFDAQPAGKRINAKMEQVERAFWKKYPNERLEKLARVIAQRTSDHQRSQLFKQVRQVLGTDPTLREPKLKQRIAAFTSENVALIKSVPQRYMEDVEKRLTAGLREGKLHSEIAKDLQERFDVSESKAKLIARDQTSKFYGELNHVRQKALGIESYVWRTANDNRVREEHEELDGEEFSWEKPPAEGHPGEAIQCRCYAEPVIPE